ncbi:hypothetical protein AOLI_G00264260 [Acnodon oligacanthus]
MVEEEAIKTLVHLHLAGWRELQAAFQDSEKYWKQLEEQQLATHQKVRSLLTELQPLVCLGAGAPLSPLLKPPVPVPRRTGALLLPPNPALRAPLQSRLSWPIPHPRMSWQAYLHPKKKVSATLSVSAAGTGLPDVPASEGVPIHGTAWFSRSPTGSFPRWGPAAQTGFPA